MTFAHLFHGHRVLLSDQFLEGLIELRGAEWIEIENGTATTKSSHIFVGKAE